MNNRHLLPVHILFKYTPQLEWPPNNANLNPIYLEAINTSGASLQQFYERSDSLEQTNTRLYLQFFEFSKNLIDI